MARLPLYKIRFSPQEQCYIITNSALRFSQKIATSQNVWQEWLKTVSSFAFEDREGGHCTIRQDRPQRGDVYWYAYRSIQGRTKKRYLGKTADLTLAHLEEVSIHFLAKEKKTFQEVLTQPPASSYRPSSVITMLETKLHPPQLPGWLVERPNLWTRLDTALSHRVTLLLAPAGFGKTTLVKQWLTTSNMLSGASWVSLEASDNDPLRFWSYVITASQKLLGPSQKAAGQDAMALLMTTPHSPFDSSPIELALTHLLNALADPSCGGLLVLDDYHAISEPRIDETLTFFIEHLPGSVHILLLSRAEPDLPLQRWRSRGELNELHGADLRFSSTETGAFLHQALSVSLSETALAHLDSTLEGWAAGLRLLSLTLSGWHTSIAIEQALLALGSQAGFHQRSLFDYFVTEILETQPPAMQHFLFSTSVLNRLCAPLCNAVLASEDSTLQLGEAVRSGLFLEALEGPGEWYRYHTLFAEAMRREAIRRLGEQTLQMVALRASLWYEQEGLLTEAIEEALLSPDRERAAQLIEQIDILSFNEPQTMRRWLEQLPETVLSEHPLLCHLFAVELCFPTELRFAINIPALPLPAQKESSRVEMLLQMAEDGWRNRGMPAWIGANLSFKALDVLVSGGPYSRVVDYSRQALGLIPSEGTLDRRLQMYRGSCMYFVGVDELRLGQVSIAHRFLRKAEEDTMVFGNRHLITDIRLALAKSFMLQGELKQAHQYLQQVLAEARKIYDHEVAVDALLELAWLAFETNDINNAERQTREAQERTQHLHPPMHEFSDRAALQMALLQYVQGETTAALEQVTATLRGSQSAWTRNSFWLRARLYDWQLRLLIVTGDLQAAQENLEGQSQSQETLSLTDYLRQEMRWGRLWLAQGKAEEALQQFTPLLVLAQENLHQHLALEIELLLALTYLALRQEQQAYYWLRQALLQAIQENTIQLFLNEGKPMIQLLRSLLADRPYDTMLRPFIQKIFYAATHISQSQQRGTEKADLLFEPLSPQELRVLQLLEAGWSNQEIARELVVSVNTVKYHTKHLYQKLGVSNRLQAASVARALSLTI